MWCLIYYNLTIIDNSINKKHNPILIFTIGLIAACLHEIISLCLIVLVSWNYLLDLFINKAKITKISPINAKCHTTKNTTFVILVLT